MKPNKYGNQWVEIDGIKFQSRKEARRWLDLKMLEKGGAIRDLKRQIPLQCEVNGEPICKLIADFWYYDLTARPPVEVFEDVKGMKSGAAYQMFSLKKKLVHACLGITVREI